MEASERERLDKETRQRLVSVVRRYQYRILGYRVLKEPIPKVERYVIVFALGESKPIKYFRYDYEKVWCWSKSVRSATVFRSYDRALHAVEHCTVKYEAPYQIRKLH